MTTEPRFVLQGGPDFYLWTRADCVGAPRIVSAPPDTVRNDYDLPGAAAARAWFESTWCHDHNVEPIWIPRTD